MMDLMGLMPYGLIRNGGYNGEFLRVLMVLP